MFWYNEDKANINKAFKVIKELASYGDIDFEKIEISVDCFRHYHQTLNEFWNKLPENLWIQIKAS